MIINKHIEVLPLHWASALINSDYSGYDEVEIDNIKEAVSELPAPVCVNDPYIGRYNGLLCEVAEYTFYIIG